MMVSIFISIMANDVEHLLICLFTIYIPSLVKCLFSSVQFSCSAAAAAKSLQLCPTLCDLIDGSPTGSPVPGILQARILEWVAILSYSVKAPQPGSLVCPVTKSTAIISIRDRGQG